MLPEEPQGGMWGLFTIFRIKIDELQMARHTRLPRHKRPHSAHDHLEVTFSSMHLDRLDSTLSHSGNDRCDTKIAHRLAANCSCAGWQTTGLFSSLSSALFRRAA